MKRAWTAVIAACVLTSWTSNALATQGESEFWVGPGVALDGTTIFAGAELGWLRHLTDFWSVGATLRDRRRPAQPGDGRTHLTADARYVVDALTWIPGAGVGLGVAADTTGTAVEFQPCARVELAVGYRAHRTWGLALRPGADLVWKGEGVTPVWTLSLAYVRYTGQGIGLDL